jgi:hypothetical protein
MRSLKPAILALGQPAGGEFGLHLLFAGCSGGSHPLPAGGPGDAGQRLLVGRLGPWQSAHEPHHTLWVRLRRLRQAAHEQADLMEIRCCRADDQRLEGAGDDLEPLAIHVDEGIDLDRLLLPTTGSHACPSVADEQHARTAEHSRREWAGVGTPPVKHHQAGLAMMFAIHEPQAADGAIAIAEPPLLGAGRIEGEPADAEDPPDVDDRLRLVERKGEEFGVAAKRLRGEMPVERGVAETLLHLSAVGRADPLQGQRFQRRPSGRMAR